MFVNKPINFETQSIQKSRFSNYKKTRFFFLILSVVNIS